ncbi:hypothetical protein EDD86DRAFT_146045 [Gorgonomyces haynaldii]|nr:hypothetical protein EDD86DRAFT_146045 [Gorgonomyces haynaldii]
MGDYKYVLSVRAASTIERRVSHFLKYNKRELDVRSRATTRHGQPSGTAAAFIARRQSNKEHDFKAILNPSHPCRNPLVKPRWLHQRQAQGTGDAQPRERKVKVHSVLHCPNSECHGMTVNRHECCAKHAPVAAGPVLRPRKTHLLPAWHTGD